MVTVKKGSMVHECPECALANFLAAGWTEVKTVDDSKVSKAGTKSAKAVKS